MHGYFDPVMVKKEHIHVCKQCRIAFYDDRVASATCPKCNSAWMVEKVDW